MFHVPHRYAPDLIDMVVPVSHLRGRCHLHVGYVPHKAAFSTYLDHGWHLLRRSVGCFSPKFRSKSWISFFRPKCQTLRFRSFFVQNEFLVSLQMCLFISYYESNNTEDDVSNNKPVHWLWYLLSAEPSDTPTRQLLLFHTRRRCLDLLMTGNMSKLTTHNVKERVKSFPSHKTHRAALISVSLALSQTPAYTARPRIRG